jgi:hypothetical protein
MPDLGNKASDITVASSKRYGRRRTVVLRDNPGLILILAFLAGVVIAFWRQILMFMAFFVVFMVLIGVTDVLDQIQATR